MQFLHLNSGGDKDERGGIELEGESARPTMRDTGTEMTQVETRKAEKAEEEAMSDLIRKSMVKDLKKK